MKNDTNTSTPEFAKFSPIDCVMCKNYINGMRIRCIHCKDGNNFNLITISDGIRMKANYDKRKEK